MANVFPELQPDTEKRARQGFHTRLRIADGGLQSNVPHPVLQYFLSLDWSTLVDTDLDTIVAHFEANRDAIFTYFEFVPRAIAAGTSIGTGSGSSGQVIALPSKATSGLLIAVNGVNFTNFTFSAGSGVDGEDRITTTSAITAGAAITMSATNTTTRRRHYVWYTTEKLEEVQVEANIYALHIDLEDKLP